MKQSKFLKEHKKNLKKLNKKQLIKQVLNLIELNTQQSIKEDINMFGKVFINYGTKNQACFGPQILTASK